MRYVSTRGQAPELGFDAVLLAGLAPDGGLYVPREWPRWDAARWRRLAQLPYETLTCEVASPFLAGSLIESELPELVREAYAGFDHPARAPLVQLDHNFWLLELFHGPTFAFKDYALQVLGRMLDRVLAKRGQRITIVTATSGDTGSAAIEACRDRASIELFVLHPEGRVSDVQRRQMTTVRAPNIHNLAIAGTFDDCQDLVKALFADAAFRDEVALGAVNSINWARIVVQSAYYAWAALALGAPERGIGFAVPTGNFGNVYAGTVARRMGLDIAPLVVGSNRNDILARFLATGEMSMGTVEPSLSPSMDIQVSSNFERLFFESAKRDGAAVARAFQGFRQSGRLTLAPDAFAEIAALFKGARIDDEATIAEIARVRRETGLIVDPHTAVGVAAARRHRSREVPMVVVATAHPAKFPDAVARAILTPPPVPARLAALANLPEQATSLANDAGGLKGFIRDSLLRRGKAA